MNSPSELWDEVEPLVTMLKGMIARAAVEKWTDAKAKAFATVQGITGFGEATDDDLEWLQPYGIASRPNAKNSTGQAEAILVNVAGNAELPICLVVADRRYFLALEAGEVALYDDQGQYVRLARDQVEVVTPKKVIVEATDGVELRTDGTPLLSQNGTLNGLAVDPYTGATHFALGNASTDVLNK